MDECCAALCTGVFGCCAGGCLFILNSIQQCLFGKNYGAGGLGTSRGCCNCSCCDIDKEHDIFEDDDKLKAMKLKTIDGTNPTEPSTKPQDDGVVAQQPSPAPEMTTAKPTAA
ncbi:hypothetical protein CPB86DRAFT_306505 [Serendipita vermifera]|nr:hypothetical protein CPB86DRAFT_306505 [Serendipita vermifera]